MVEEPVADLNSKSNLLKLLDELGEHPERVDEITKRIRDVFEQERTVMVLDMSGFTRATQQGNVISFLLSINQMQRLVTPVVEEHAGIVVRAEHDNLTCLFDRVADALAACREVGRRLESANVILPSDKELYASMGIGHGPILNIGNEEIYGNEINLASKLGEDIATLGEILLTPNAHEQIKGDEELESRVVSISGLDLQYFAVPAERRPA